MTADLNFVVVDVDAGVALAERQAYAAAQQRQLREHFAPLWDGLGETSCVRAATPDAPPLAGEVEIRLLKNAPADQQGALAIHDRKPDGTPICYIYDGLLRQYGQPWTSAASHEVLEVMCDPRLRLCVEMDDGFWDHEIADRVEQDTVMVDGVALSSFNTPACFEPATTPAAGTKFDYLGLSVKANEVRPGGYAQQFDASKGWTQIQNGEMSPYRAHLMRLGLGRVARRQARYPKPWWRKLLNWMFRR